MFFLEASKIKIVMLTFEPSIVTSEYLSNSTGSSAQTDTQAQCLE